MNNAQCIKCKQIGSVVLRGRDTYCERCFLTNVTHKVRSSLGKNRLLRSNERVLLALSGGCSSTIMLDIIHDAVQLNNHKKLRVQAICVHVMGCETPLLPIQKQTTNAQKLIEFCEALGLQIYIAHISTLDFEDIRSPNVIPKLDNENIENINHILVNMTQTARSDYICKIRRKMFIKYAVKLNCDYVLVGDSAVTMASNMLSGIVVGRGKQVQYDVGFCDFRNKINILRPMKEVTMEELKTYIEIKKLDGIENQECNENSLQHAILSFVHDLQGNSQATISTVCKTADKIGTQDNTKQLETLRVCVLCESPLKYEDTKLTALHATNFSRAISTDPRQFNDETKVANYLDYNKLMFPLIDDVLCYGCSRTRSEMKVSDLLTK